MQLDNIDLTTVWPDACWQRKWACKYHIIISMCHFEWALSTIFQCALNFACVTCRSNRTESYLSEVQIISYLNFKSLARTSTEFILQWEKERAPERERERARANSYVCYTGRERERETTARLTTSKKRPAKMRC